MSWWVGAENCLLDTGQDGTVIDLALFVAVIALPQMTHTHTENEGSTISYDFLEFLQLQDVYKLLQVYK